MDKERLEKIVREKEAKAHGYQPCDAYWLLVFVDFFNRAQDQEIRIDNPHVHSEVFEKIVIFKTVFNQIVEVK